MTDSNTDFDADDDEIETLPGDRRGPRILLAEDDLPLRELLTSILDLEGHDVTAVPSADDMRRELSLLETDRRCPFDVIVTDVRMPGLSTLDFLASLRASGRDIPVIVMTAFPEDDVRRRALDLGAILVAKPFALDVFCSAVRCMVSLPSGLGARPAADRRAFGTMPGDGGEVAGEEDGAWMH